MIVFNGILSLGSIQRIGKSLTIKLIEKWKMNRAEDSESNHEIDYGIQKTEVLENDREMMK